MVLCHEGFQRVEKGETQEEMLGEFYIRTTNTYCTHSVPKVVSKFQTQSC